MQITSNSTLSLCRDLRTLVDENLLFGQTDGFYSDDDSFMEKGIVDSTGVLQLVTLLEEQFQIRILDDDLVPENLDSINNLGRFIEAKWGAMASGGAACK